MSYQVIARKWRPQRFCDMVGQEHIARTLKNSIITGRIAHAYLFVGPRGIGKTTSARIFAKALNCEHPVDGEPCCECPSCKAIANETSVDVIEIDAATHTQVDKAREICEEVLHMPIASKYKIYIIDEVHMLSKSAWNALLKTIEEPPAHAKFIFATTEVNKVLPTVISRCQRFDLRRISSVAIAERLRMISDAEKVNVSDSAIQVIAHAADGGMRDAQSLLDQLISFFGTDENTQISEQQALALFGLTAPGDMEDLMDSILSNDRATAISTIHKFAEQGKNLESLFEDIIAWLRAILLCRILPNPETVLEDSPEKINIYMKMAQNVNPGVAQRLLESFSANGYMLREAINKQVFIESILLKAMRIAHAVQIEDLIARLNQIRSSGELNALDSVVPLYELPPQLQVAGAASHIAPVNRHPESVPATPVPSVEPVKPANPVQPAEPVEVAQKKNLSDVTESPAPRASAPAPEPVAVSVPPVASPAEVVPETSPAPVPVSAEPVKSAAPVPSVDSSVPVSAGSSEAESSTVESSDALAESDGEDPGETVEKISESAPTEVRAASPLPENVTMEDRYDAKTIWHRLIIDMTDNLKRPAIAELMMQAIPQDIMQSSLFVAFDQIYGDVARQAIEREKNQLTLRLQVISGDSKATLFFESRPGIATPEQVEAKVSVEEMKREVAQNPLVRQTIDLFEGHLVDVLEAK